MRGDEAVVAEANIDGSREVGGFIVFFPIDGDVAAAERELASVTAHSVPGARFASFQPRVACSRRM
jgi:hypothetical protein